DGLVVDLAVVHLSSVSVRFHGTGPAGTGPHRRTSAGAEVPHLGEVFRRAGVGGGCLQEGGQPGVLVAVRHVRVAPFADHGGPAGVDLEAFERIRSVRRIQYGQEVPSVDGVQPVRPAGGAVLLRTPDLAGHIHVVRMLLQPEADPADGRADILAGAHLGVVAHAAARNFSSGRTHAWRTSMASGCVPAVTRPTRLEAYQCSKPRASSLLNTSARTTRSAPGRRRRSAYR